MSAFLALILTTTLWAAPLFPPKAAPPGNPAQPAPTAPTLGSWHIDKKQISISGVSSGAYMAVQMGVAYSKDFSAVASVAGGIFWCSEGDSQKAQGRCMGRPQEIDAKVQIDGAKRFASEGKIDPLSNLANQNIYIFASPKDAVINPVNSDKLTEFYSAFMKTEGIQLEKSVTSAHGFATLSAGNPCQMGFLPWLLKCNFDLAGMILKSAYGELKERGTADPAHLIKYSQTDFGDAKTPLFKEAWVYVPKTCQAGEQCRLHVALHGCQMNPDFIQDKFATLAGYNEWAETNNIIVLYPQSAKIQGSNPYACWDWFGFTGENYMTKEGPQMKALKKMIERVSN